MPLHEGWRGGNGCMSCATEGQGNGPNIDDLSNFYNAYGNCDGCHDRGVQNIKRDMEGGSPTPQNFRGRQGKGSDGPADQPMYDDEFRVEPFNMRGHSDEGWIGAIFSFMWYHIRFSIFATHTQAGHSGPNSMYPSMGYGTNPGYGPRGGYYSNTGDGRDGRGGGNGTFTWNPAGNDPHSNTTVGFSFALEDIVEGLGRIYDGLFGG